VHLVAGALGQRLAQAGDLDAGLERVIGGDQADVPPADGEQPLGWPHQVPVGQRLEGARAIDPGQRVSLKGQRFFPRAGGDQQDVGLNDDVAPFPQHADLAVGEGGQRCRVEPDLDVLELVYLLLQFRRDVGPARPGVAGVDRAKELVGLEDQLAAQPVLVVDDERAHAGLAQLDRRR
jgi:hypothetical protein